MQRKSEGSAGRIVNETSSDKKKRSDAQEAIRFMLIKAAIFILVPAIAAGIAAYMVLR